MSPYGLFKKRSQKEKDNLTRIFTKVGLSDEEIQSLVNAHFSDTQFVAFNEEQDQWAKASNTIYNQVFEPQGSLQQPVPRESKLGQSDAPLAIPDGTGGAATTQSDSLVEAAGMRGITNQLSSFFRVLTNEFQARRRGIALNSSVIEKQMQFQQAGLDGSGEYLVSNEANLGLFGPYVQHVTGGIIGVGSHQVLDLFAGSQARFAAVVDMDRATSLLTRAVLEVGLYHRKVYGRSPTETELIDYFRLDHTAALRHILLYDFSVQDAERIIDRLRQQVKITSLTREGIDYRSYAQMLAVGAGSSPGNSSFSWVASQARIDRVLDAYQEGRIYIITGDVMNPQTLENLTAIAREQETNYDVLFLSNVNEWIEDESRNTTSLQAINRFEAGLPMGPDGLILRTIIVNPDRDMALLPQHVQKDPVLRYYYHPYHYNVQRKSDWQAKFSRDPAYKWTQEVRDLDTQGRLPSGVSSFGFDSSKSPDGSEQNQQQTNQDDGLGGGVEKSDAQQILPKSKFRPVFGITEMTFSLMNKIMDTDPLIRSFPVNSIGMVRAGYQRVKSFAEVVSRGGQLTASQVLRVQDKIEKKPVVSTVTKAINLVLPAFVALALASAAVVVFLPLGMLTVYQVATVLPAIFLISVLLQFVASTALPIFPKTRQQRMRSDAARLLQQTNIDVPLPSWLILLPERIGTEILYRNVVQATSRATIEAYKSAHSAQYAAIHARLPGLYDLQAEYDTAQAQSANAKIQSDDATLSYMSYYRAIPGRTSTNIDEDRMLYEAGLIRREQEMALFGPSLADTEARLRRVAARYHIDTPSVRETSVVDTGLRFMFLTYDEAILIHPTHATDEGFYNFKRRMFSVYGDSPEALIKDETYFKYRLFHEFAHAAVGNDSPTQLQDAYGSIARDIINEGPTDLMAYEMGLGDAWNSMEEFFAILPPVEQQVYLRTTLEIEKKLIAKGLTPREARGHILRAQRYGYAPLIQELGGPDIIIGQYLQDLFSGVSALWDSIFRYGVGSMQATANLMQWYSQWTGQTTGTGPLNLLNLAPAAKPSVSSTLPEDGLGGGGAEILIQPANAVEAAAKPVAEAMADAIKNAADNLEQKNCGTGFLPGRQQRMADGSGFSGFGGFFGKYVVNHGNGDNSKEGGNLRLGDDGIQIDHSSSRISSALYARYKNNIPVAKSKVNTTRSLVTNIAANQAIPALVADAENTRSIGLVSSKEKVIGSHFTPKSSIVSINFSLIPPAFAADGSDPSGRMSLGCGAARVVAGGLRTAANFTAQTSRQMPNRWALDSTVAVWQAWQHRSPIHEGLGGGGLYNASRDSNQVDSKKPQQTFLFSLSEERKTLLDLANVTQPLNSTQIGELVRLMDHNDFIVSETAIDLLMHNPSGLQEFIPEILEKAMRLSEHEDVERRHQVALLMKLLDDRALQVIDMYLQDKESYVRRAAVAALMNKTFEQIAPRLSAIWEADPDENNRRQVVDVYASYNQPEAITFLQHVASASMVDRSTIEANEMLLRRHVVTSKNPAETALNYIISSRSEEPYLFIIGALSSLHEDALPILEYLEHSSGTQDDALIRKVVQHVRVDWALENWSPEQLNQNDPVNTSNVLLWSQEPLFATTDPKDLETVISTAQTVVNEMKQKHGDRFIGIGMYGSTGHGYRISGSDADVTIVATDQTIVSDIRTALETRLGQKAEVDPFSQSVVLSDSFSAEEKIAAWLYQGVFIGSNLDLYKAQRATLNFLTPSQWDMVRRTISIMTSGPQVVEKLKSRFSMSNTADFRLEIFQKLLRVPPDYDQTKRILEQRTIQQYDVGLGEQEALGGGRVDTLIQPANAVEAAAKPVAEAMADAIKNAAVDLEQKNCGTGFLPNPSLLAGTLGVFGGFEVQMREQKTGDNNEHIGNTRIGQKIFKADILNHRLALLSVNQSEANNPTITDGKLASNILAYSHGDALVRPGLMRSSPIHPDVRLINMPADTAANVFGENNSIGFQISIQPESLSTKQEFSFIPQAYAADGPVSGRGVGAGCAAARMAAAALRPVRAFTSTTLWKMPVRGIIPGIIPFIPMESVWDGIREFYNWGLQQAMQATEILSRLSSLEAAKQAVITNDPVISQVITGAFLLSDLLSLPVDILSSFFWRAVTHLVFFPQTTVGALEARGWHIVGTEIREAGSTRGIVRIPVLTVATSIGDVLEFVPAGRAPQNEQLLLADPRPEDFPLVPLTADALKTPSPIRAILARAITSNVFVFILAQLAADALGDAIGIRISPMIVAPVVFLPRAIVSGVISNVVRGPIRFGVNVLRIGSSVFRKSDGSFVNTSPRVSIIREWYVLRAKPVLDRFTGFKTDCLGINLHFGPERVYADDGTSPSSLSTCGLWLTPARVVRALIQGNTDEVKEWARLLVGGGSPEGGGGEAGKASPFFIGGLGVGAGFAIFARNAFPPDACGFTALDKLRKVILNFFGMKDGQKCTQLENTTGRTPIPPGSEGVLGVEYSCQAGADGISSIYQMMPSGTKADVGTCNPGFGCSTDGTRCERTVDESRVQSFLSELNTEIARGALRPDDPLVRGVWNLARTRGIFVYPDESFQEWQLARIIAVCDSLPEYYCRGQVLQVGSPPVGDDAFCDGEYIPRDKRVVHGGDYSLINCSEEKAGYFDGQLIHELTHKVTTDILGSSQYGRVCNPNDADSAYCNRYLSIPNSSPAFMDDYAAAAGWFWDEARGKWSQTGSDADTGADFDYDVNDEPMYDYRLDDIWEHSAELAKLYYADSARFKETWPDVYPLYHEILFDGKIYNNGVPIVP